LRLHRHERVWSFDAPPVEVWPILSNTARFNEAAGLPKHDITETPQDDGSVLFTAVAKQGPFTLAWRDTPSEAVPPTFVEPGQALAAALEIQQAMSAFNRDHASEAGGEDMVAIKVGIHEGACIAVTLNDRLDYFGGTLNMTARLQGQSRGGDIIVSTSMAENPAVATLLAQRNVSEESEELRGFDARVGYLRIDEAMHKVASGDQ
jgi:class 3 adenylate cyclase